MADAALAAWCVGTGFGPDVYYSLTLAQRGEFAKAVNRANKK